MVHYAKGLVALSHGDPRQAIESFKRALAINADYPKISERGSFPATRLSYGPAFAEFLDELESDDFRRAFEEKFGLDLSGRPTTVTVVGRDEL